MKSIWNWFISKTTISENYIFMGDIVEFERLLQIANNYIDRNQFSLEKLENSYFKIIAKSSAGVLMLNWRIISFISIYGKYEIIDSYKVSVKFRSKTRIEIYIFCLISIISLIAMVYNIKSLPFWPFLIPIITIPWFNWIYMIQTNALVASAKKFFKLKKNTLFNETRI